jgi:hypothetical protein
MDDPELAEDAYQSAIFHFNQDVEAIDAHYNRLERRKHRQATRQERLLQKNSSGSGKTASANSQEKEKRTKQRKGGEQEGPLSWEDASSEEEDEDDGSGSEYSEGGEGDWSGPEDWTEDWADDWADGNDDNSDGNGENPDGSSALTTMTYPPLLAQCHYNFALLLHERRALLDAALQYQLAVDCRAAQGEGLYVELYYTRETRELRKRVN